MNFSAFMLTLDVKNNPSVVTDDDRNFYANDVRLVDDAVSWLETNCKGYYDYRPGEKSVSLIFKRREDAAMFKLFWL